MNFDFRDINWATVIAAVVIVYILLYVLRR